ncbi:MAG: hypothetical protein AAGC55_15580 [Myxococcota bacterium]
MATADLRCAASAAERAAARPGDDAIAPGGRALDHGITIAAPPAAVWPWLAQMGSGRAGWYSYDRLDNGGVPSARHIQRDLQDIAIGTVIPALPGVTEYFVVTELSAPRYLVLGVPGARGAVGPIGSDTWRQSFSRANSTYWLSPDGDSGCRLHVRIRLGTLAVHLPGLGERSIPSGLARRLLQPFHFIMQRKQLVEIRRRAEGG